MDIEKYAQDMLLNLNKLEQTLLSLPSIKQNTISEKWNAVQILEHIYLVEQGVIFQFKHGKGIGLHDAESILGQEKLQRILIGLRAKKTASPEMFLPKGKFEHGSQAITELGKFRNNWLQELQNSNLQISNAIFEHPYLGKMTISDWLYFLHTHAERHLLQMQELA